MSGCGYSSTRGEISLLSRTPPCLCMAIPTNSGLFHPFLRHHRSRRLQRRLRTRSRTLPTICSNPTTLESRPHLVILFTPSCPLIDASITISTPIYAGFRPTTTLESLPPSVRRLRFMFKSVGKRTEEKTLRSAVVVCPPSKNSNRGRVLVLHRPPFQISSCPGYAYTRDRASQSNERRA